MQVHTYSCLTRSVLATSRFLSALLGPMTKGSTKKLKMMYGSMRESLKGVGFAKLLVATLNRVCCMQTKWSSRLGLCKIWCTFQRCVAPCCWPCQPFDVIQQLVHHCKDIMLSFCPSVMPLRMVPLLCSILM